MASWGRGFWGLGFGGFAVLGIGLRGFTVLGALQSWVQGLGCGSFGFRAQGVRVWDFLCFVGVLTSGFEQAF